LEPLKYIQADVIEYDPNGDTQKKRGL